MRRGDADDSRTIASARRPCHTTSADPGRAPLGAVESWPQSLRTTVAIMLGSPVPTAVLWGPELVQLYNDAYIPIARERHPAIGTLVLTRSPERHGFRPDEIERARRTRGLAT